MRFRPCSLGVLLVCLVAAPAWAQSKVETQLFLDMRVLQGQVQQLTLAVNTLAEKLKGTDGRLEEQATALARGFAEQKSQIDALAAQQRSLTNSENDTALRMMQLSTELQAIRTGLEKQQTALNEILTLLQTGPGAGAASAAADPNAPAGAGAPARTPVQTSIPPSPGAIYGNAKNYFYSGDFKSAIDLLGDAIKRFPDSPDAPMAQNMIGDSQDQLGHTQEALAAYGLVTKNYTDPERVAEAYYKQGMIYEKLNQKDNAIKSYQDCIKLAGPTSSQGVLATNALKRLGIK